MKSWCLEADVYFLEPQTLKEGEDTASFANRVQRMVAKKAGLHVCPWDGYLKYFKPNPRFRAKRQKMFAEVLLKNLEADSKGIPRGASLGDLENLDEDTVDAFAKKISSPDPWEEAPEVSRVCPRPPFNGTRGRGGVGGSVSRRGHGGRALLEEQEEDSTPATAKTKSRRKNK